MRNISALRPILGLTAASACVGMAASLTVAPAQAAPHVSDPLAEGLVTPLQMDVVNGKVYVAQAFAGLVSKVRPDGSVKDLVVEKGASTGGVAVRGKKVAYTINDDEGKMRAQLKLRKRSGKTKRIADLQRFEENHNPDAVNTYGFLDLDPYCAAQVPEEIGGEPYPGIVDTNPYALANRHKRGWYVADAGANAIFDVTETGRVRTLAVLPPLPTEITADAAGALGLPECVVGSHYAFEPVPTDVEVAENGALFVTLLPGGPESPALGARGAVVRINPWSGRIRTVAQGFFAATNLALGGRGRVYVTEMFGDKVSVVKDGTPKTFVELPMPGAIEHSDGRLYVATSVLDEENGGSIVKVRR